MRKAIMLAASLLVLSVAACKASPDVSGTTVQEQEAGNLSVKEDSAKEEGNVSSGDSLTEKEDKVPEEGKPKTVTAESLLTDWGNTFAEVGYADISMKLSLDYHRIKKWDNGDEFYDEVFHLDETLDAKMDAETFYFNRKSLANTQGYPMEQSSECWIGAEEGDGEYEILKWSTEDECWYYGDDWDSDIVASLHDIKKVFTKLNSSVYQSLSLEDKGDVYLVIGKVDLPKLLALCNAEDSGSNYYFTEEYFEAFTFDLDVIYTFDKATGDLDHLALAPSTLAFESSDLDLYFETFVCELAVNELGDKELEFMEDDTNIEEGPYEFFYDWYEFDVYHPNIDNIPYALIPVSTEEYVEKEKELSNDWTELEFFLDGKVHTLGEPLYTIVGNWQPYDEGELEEADYSTDIASVSLKNPDADNLLHVGMFTLDGEEVLNRDRHMYKVEYEGDWLKIRDKEEKCDLQIAGFKLGDDINTVLSVLGEHTKFGTGSEMTYRYYADHGRSCFDVTAYKGIITGMKLEYDSTSFR